MPLALALVTVAVPTSASSAADIASTGPAASQAVTPSPAPAADCTDLVALLPANLGDGSALTATPTVGVQGIDPDDLLDPFLASVGAGRDDVCGVSLRADDEAVGSVALLLRVRGSGPGLAATFSAALADRLRGYGRSVAEDDTAIEGSTVHRLTITSSGATTVLLVAAATPDSVVVSPSHDLLAHLLPWLPGAPSASSSVPPGPSGGPSATPGASNG
jgi:hypothetical protein